MMNQGSPFPSGGAHRDVLDAPIPDSVDGRERLITEIKNRGRAAVQAEYWPDACNLYRKALAVLQYKGENGNTSTASAGVSSDIAIIYSNLALTEGKMNKWDDAKLSALEATVADPVYVKGWWRLGQAQAAMENYTESIQSFETALKLEPSNKALQKELTKMKEKQIKAEKEAEKKKAAAALAETTSTNDNSTTSNKPAVTKQKTTTATTTTSSKSKAKSDTVIEPMDVDGTEFTKSDFVKGYKIVNGKKTSFFHNELSEEAKKLIGDIAPKKLESIPDATVESTTGTTTTTNDPTKSVWNKAGTWEERDVSEWAKTTLQAAISSCTYILPSSSPAPGAIISISKTQVQGTASVASVRGKKRYIYEYNVQIEWKFIHNLNVAEGKLTFADIDGTCIIGEGYDVSNFTITSMTDPTVRPLLESFVQNQGLRDTLHTAIDNWVRSFQETY